MGSDIMIMKTLLAFILCLLAVCAEAQQPISLRSTNGQAVALTADATGNVVLTTDSRALTFTNAGNIFSGFGKSNNVNSVDLNNRALSDAAGTIALNWATYNFFGVWQAPNATTNNANNVLTVGLGNALYAAIGSGSGSTNGFAHTNETAALSQNNPSNQFSGAIAGATNVLAPAPFDTAQQVVENWTNLTQWTSSGLAATAGSIASVSGANPSEATFNMPLAATDTAHFRCVINLASLASQSADILVGVWAGATNATAGGTAGLYGYGYRRGYGTTNIQFESALNGGLTPAGSLLSTGLVYVDLSIDANIVSWLFHDAAHTFEIGATNTRASIGAINGFAIWDTSTSDTVGQTTFRKSMVPASGSLIETNDFTAYTVDDANDAIRYQLPPNYNPNIGANAFIQMHGNGWDQTTVWTGSDGGGATERAYYYGLVTNGNILLSSFGFGNNWGSTNGVNAILNAATFLQEHFNVRNIYVIRQSMGFLSCINAINEQRLKLSGAIGLFPVCSLVNLTNAFWNNITNYPAYSNILSQG
jgi:hypothetical protein